MWGYVCSMLDVRLRLPDLMRTFDPPMKSAYALMKASKGALTITTAVRLVEANGRPKRLDMATLDTLCDIFDVGPGELLERDKRPRSR
jgi:DNA-binding Xre family transcriptional regulator